MNILAMLARLEAALGHSHLTRQMVLLPAASASDTTGLLNTNLVVAYNGSPRSQTALDLTLWIAHQTRLASSKPVNVQVVYVVDAAKPKRDEHPQFLPLPSRKRNRNSKTAVVNLDETALSSRSSGNTAVAELTVPSKASLATPASQFEQFEHADRILWQARTLAEEWRGSLKTHLRFGAVAQELCQVIDSEAASLLIVGCESNEHPLIEQLKTRLTCPVLGIPPATKTIP